MGVGIWSVEQNDLFHLQMLPRFVVQEQSHKEALKVVLVLHFSRYRSPVLVAIIDQLQKNENVIPFDQQVFSPLYDGWEW